MSKQFETEIKVGLFVCVGVGLTMLAILVLGSTENLMVAQNRYQAYFQSVDGLIPGAKVVIGGFQIGSVDQVDLDGGRHMIRISMAVARKFQDWIRRDSTVEIVTQGVLGDKYLSINPGTPETSIAPSGTELANRPARDLTQFLSKGDQLMASLNNIATTLDHLLKTFESGNRSEIFFQGLASTAKNLSAASEKLSLGIDDTKMRGALANLNSILAKVNNGTGTLGAMVNDPGLYDDVKALFGGVNRNRIMRNLVRQTVEKQEETDSENAAKPAPKPSGRK